MANDVMIDIETLSLSHNAHIVSIGACKMWEPDHSFYEVIKMENQNRKIDAGTVEWWMKQPDNARQVFQEGDNHLTDVLLQFEGWMENIAERKDITAWSHGDDFDLVVLSNAYQTSLHKNAPWEYWNTRDTRTIIDMVERVHGNNMKPIREGTHHNALDDAIFQANWMRNCLEFLGA